MSQTVATPEQKREAEYQNQMQMMKGKYHDNLVKLSLYDPANKIEMHICFVMLCYNARAYKRGDLKSIIPGAGTVNMAELIKDVEKLDSIAAGK